MFASNKWSPLNVYSSQSKFDCGEWREEGWLDHSCKHWRKRNICYDTDKVKMIMACKCWPILQSSLLLQTLKSPQNNKTDPSNSTSSAPVDLEMWIFQAQKHFKCTILWITLTYRIQGKTEDLEKITCDYILMTARPSAEPNPESTLFIHQQSNHWHTSNQKLLMLKLNFFAPMLPSNLDQSLSVLRGVMVTMRTLDLCLINVVGPEWGSHIDHSRRD